MVIYGILAAILNFSGHLEATLFSNIHIWFL